MSNMASRHRRHLRSAMRHYLVVPRLSLSLYGRHALFVVAGPTAWNSLSDDLRDPSFSTDSFIRLLKTLVFRVLVGPTHTASEVSHFMRYIFTTYFTYLLTYTSRTTVE